MYVRNNHCYKERLHPGPIAIFVGLIFLFAGDGSNIQIANNAPLFVIAVVFNVLYMLLANARIRLNYITNALLILFVFNLIYLCIGNYEYSITMGLFLNFLLVLTTMYATHSARDIKLIIDGAILSSVIFAVLLLLFGEGYSGAIHTKTTYTQSFGSEIEFEPNFLALLLITGFELSVWCVIKNIEYRRVKIAARYSIAAILTFVASLLTGSRSAWVTAIVFALALTFTNGNKRVKKYLIIGCIVLVAALALAFSSGLISEDIYARLFEDSYYDGSNIHRLMNWKYGLQSMLDNLLGSGPHESAKILYRAYGYRSAAHNTFLAFGTYYGFIGFVAFAAIPIGLVISAWKLGEKEMAAMIISMIVEWNVLECQHTLAQWIFILICILFLQKRKHGEEVNIFG